MADPITTIAASDSGTVVVDAVNANFAKRNYLDGAAKTTTYTVVLPGDEFLRCDATSAAFTVTLPAAASNENACVTIMKTDSSGNAVTVDGNASETINGTTTRSLSSQYACETYYCTGSAWLVVWKA